MKKYILLFICALTVGITACGKTEESPAEPAVQTGPAKEETEQKNEPDVSDSDTKKEKKEDNDKAEKTEAVFKDDFKSTLEYIKKTGGKPVSLDYSKKPELDGRIAAYSADSSYKDIEAGLDLLKLTRVNALRKDNDVTAIVDVYRDRETGEIKKIEASEIGSLRRVTGWYFKDGNIIYEYRYNDDIYGTNTHREDYPLDGENEEEEVLNEGYITYDAVKSVPGCAKVYGYVGDEYGGVLENVYCTVKTASGDFEEQVKTNGDGYYEIFLPVHPEDYYNISFTYGDFVPDSANDIHITEGVSEYSCGTMYMAESGKNAHDTDVYFMNINKKAPDELKDGEYEAVLEYETDKAELKPYYISMSDGKSSSEEKFIFKPEKGKDFKFFIKDGKNYGSDNMAYDMSKCDARVTVYDKDGIAFCFNAPVGHAGVAWEVFEVKNGRVIPVNNYYFETVEGVFD